MSVKSSFFMLAMLTFLLMIGFEFINWKDDRKEVTLKAEQYAQESVQSFKKVLTLKSDAFKKQALDYASWNDLAHYTHTKDKTWAQDNLAGSSTSFGIDGFYIIDASKNVLFTETEKAFLKPIASLIDLNLLNVKSPELNHFFIKTEQGIVEFFIAPIHRVEQKISNDSLAQGFVIIAKMWDETFMEELNAYGIAHISTRLLPLNTYNIMYELPLYRLDGKVATKIYVYVQNRMGEVLDTYAMEDMKLSVIHSLILMVVFALLIAKFISVPLRDITLALKKQHKEPLKPYLSKKNEYGSIAIALNEAFETKKALESLNQNLEKKIHDEVANNRLKDRVLFQQAKLAALGEMLTNIAHQWRQPLATISVIVSKLYLKNQSEKITPELLNDEIHHLRVLIQEMSTTIDDFKDFFQSDKEKSEFSLFTCIEESVRISDGGLSKGMIAITIDCPQSLLLHGLKKELSHVFLVLINNAKDAIVERKIDQGIVFIKAYEQEHYVIIEVCDNAGGVEEGMLPRLFDPFFTTKAEKQGSGVGLYISKQIIEQGMQGSMNATNTEEGLCVSIVLPKEESL